VSAQQNAAAAAAKRGARTGLLLPSQLAPATLKFWFHQHREKRSDL